MGHIILASAHAASVWVMCIFHWCLAGLTELHNVAFQVRKTHKGMDRQQKSWQSWSITQCCWRGIQIKWLQRTKGVQYILSRNSYCISRHVQLSAFSCTTTKLLRCLPSMPCLFLSTPLTTSSRYKKTSFILNNLCKQSAFTKAYLRFHKMASK